MERVRPKMMTVVAIMAGLPPILWGNGTGSEIMSRIAAPMVVGMLSSTVFDAGGGSCDLCASQAVAVEEGAGGVRFGAVPHWKCLSLSVLTASAEISNMSGHLHAIFRYSPDSFVGGCT